MYKRLVILMFVSLFAAGCGAPTVKLAENNRSALSSVYLNPEMTVVEDMYYMGPGASIFGAIGAATQIKPSERIRQFAIENGVRIENLVKQAMIDEFKSKGHKISSSKEQASSILYLDIYWYGFSVPHGFSSELVPLVGVSAHLKDKSGATIWSGRENIQVFGNPVEPLPAKEVVNNAAMIKACWRQAAEAVAKKLTETL